MEITDYTCEHCKCDSELSCNHCGKPLVVSVKWLSVDEQLPVSDGIFFCAFDTDEFAVCIFGLDSKTWISYMKETLVNPTHWMPLPKPPKR